jgi:hypothetical protein
MELHWFLAIGLYHCLNNMGGDPGIIQGNCSFQEQKLVMPSLEVCRAVRAVNPDSKCLGEQIDDDKVQLAPHIVPKSCGETCNN